jgi:hypothetical protein
MWRGSVATGRDGRDKRGLLGDEGGSELAESEVLYEIKSGRRASTSRRVGRAVYPPRGGRRRPVTAAAISGPSVRLLLGARRPFRHVENRRRQVRLPHRGGGLPATTSANAPRDAARRATRHHGPFLTSGSSPRGTLTPSSSRTARSSSGSTRAAAAQQCKYRRARNVLIVQRVRAVRRRLT